ncbi:MAG: hypothetical protein DI628_06610 [Blastochloris viridis]|uniref:Uncharacterized protein n=1 Tax=Blastochloris viridis TaxID=1079 RepID=A0A6N4RA21_BLAVI|nr:MAG: hypothetical protein DI628_06610 [Blastochloris viridis]
MTKSEAAIAATSPFFRESDLLTELKKRGFKDPEPMLSTLRSSLKRAREDFQRDSGRSHKILSP